MYQNKENLRCVALHSQNGGMEEAKLKDYSDFQRKLHEYMC